MNGSIRRRSRASWELTIDLGRGPDGKRRRKFVSVKGMKVDAERKLREILSSLDKGIPVATDRIKVADWLDRWLAEYVEPTCRTKTIERYEGIVRMHLKPYIGHLQLSDLSPADLRTLEMKLLGQGMTAKGVGLVHTVMHGALRYAVHEDVLGRNIAQAVTPPRVERKEVEPPDISVIRKILNLGERQGHPLFPSLHLIAYTGMRRGEALGLRWQDVNFDMGTVSIVQTLGRSLKGLTFEPPKTNSGRRSIDLDSRTVDVLRSHRGRQLLEKMKAEGAYEDKDLVFADPIGGVTNPMAVTRAFQSLARQVGLAKVRLHDLRHFHATVMLQQGQSPALVSKRLGHATVTTTMDIYSHVLPGWQKEAANAFAKAMDEG